jgi:predicted MFS family arabinose efflux permease
MTYPFLPIFGRGLGVELYLLSLALTLRSATGLFGPLLASVGDTRGRKFGMLLGTGMFTTAAGAAAIFSTYPAFVFMLVLSYMANFVFLPSMQAYLSDKTPYTRRALVLGLTEFSWSLAFILGVPAAGWVIDRSGWQAPFAWLAGLGAVCLVTLAILLPKDGPRPTGPNPLRGNLRLVFTTAPALAGVLLGLLMGGSNELVNLIFGVWLEDSFAVQIGALAAASAIIGVSELGGEALVSGLADRLGKRRAVALGLVSNVLAALALPILGRSLPGAMAGLFLFYISFEFTIVSTLPFMTEVLPAARATFMAAFIASTGLGRSLTSLVAPHLYSLGRSFGQESAMWIIVAASAALTFAGLAALRAIPERAEDAPVAQPRKA